MKNSKSRPSTSLVALTDEGIVVTEDGTLISGLYSMDYHLEANGSSTVTLVIKGMRMASAYPLPTSLDDIKDAIAGLLKMEDDLS